MPYLRQPFGFSSGVFHPESAGGLLRQPPITEVSVTGPTKSAASLLNVAVIGSRGADVNGGWAQVPA